MLSNHPFLFPSSPVLPLDRQQITGAKERLVISTLNSIIIVYLHKTFNKISHTL